MAEYFTAKLRLFSEVLDPDGTAVVWVDDPQSARVVDLARERRNPIISVGVHGETLRLEIGRAHVELQSLMRISYAVFCLKKKNNQEYNIITITIYETNNITTTRQAY